MEYRNLAEIKPNPKNPRVIKDGKFKQLVESLRTFPEMLEKRPLVCVTDPEDGLIYPLGGNMRLKAALELQMGAIPIEMADEWTPEQREEFVIKDNVGFGDWDHEELKANWDLNQLEAWGMDIGWSSDKETVNIYTKKIDSPVYEPTGEKPSLNLLLNNEKSLRMKDKILASSLPDAEKLFLIAAAERHNVFNYSLIAEYYSQSNKEVQELMEESALVIIDFKKAIELGFVRLSEEISKQYNEDYTDED